MKKEAERAIALCRSIANCSEEPGRTTRRYLTEPVHAVHAILRTRMEALGMIVRVDAVGNLRGVWTGEPAHERRLMIGSHIDTVPDAGAFDGVLGVALALEWVEIAQKEKLAINIEVVAFSEEEGVRFGVPFLGSRAVAAKFDTELLALKDADGVSMAESIRRFGLDPEQILYAESLRELNGFVEIHIEQGPVLDSENLSVAVVESIVGQTRGEIIFKGVANHAGTTPMDLRHDALTAAAEWILAVERAARETNGLVATIGKIEVEPNAGNVIAGCVRTSLDLRHSNDGIHKEMVEGLIREAEEIGTRRGVGVEWRLKLDQSAVPMDERLTALMSASLVACGHPARVMTSGAGHDAMVLATRTPTTMLFLRSPGGISHHPDENVRVEDVEAALTVGKDFLRRFSSAIG
jgi:allantoate deiminase